MIIKTNFIFNRFKKSQRFIYFSFIFFFSIFFFQATFADIIPNVVYAKSPVVSTRGVSDDNFNQQNFSIFIYYFNYFVFTLGFISFLRLIWSYKAIDAVTSFFGVLISLVYFFFFIRADYVGSIILMVYLGAIIIFFCFIIFTINPEKFAPASSIYKRGFNFSFFFFFILYFYVYYTSLSVILSDFFINFIPNDYTDVYDIWSFSNSDTSYVHVLGSILYTYYFIPVNMLGIMLFISLVGSLRMLNPINKKKVIVYINSKNI